MKTRWTLVAAMVMAGRVAWADPPSVEAAMAEGEAAYEAHRYDEAITIYAALYARSHDIQALARLAQAEQAAGRWLDAWRHYEAVLTHSNHEWVDARRERLVSQQQLVDTHLGRLFVRTVPSGLVACVGDMEMGRTPVETRLLPGVYRLQIGGPGLVLDERSIDVQAGRNVVEDIRVPSMRSAEVPSSTGLWSMAPRSSVEHPLVQPAARTPSPVSTPIAVAELGESRPSYTGYVALTVVGGLGVLSGLFLLGSLAFSSDWRTPSGGFFEPEIAYYSLIPLAVLGLPLTGVGIAGIYQTSLDRRRYDERRRAFHLVSGPGTFGLGVAHAF